MITLLLILFTAYLSFQIGRRWEEGNIEKVNNAIESQRLERGRQGTLRLNTIRIRR